MITYVVAVLALGIFWLDPILRLFSPGPTSIRRTARPPLNESLLALGTASNLSCAPDAYSVHIFSREPLVLYIENFLPEEERTHLLDISNPIFEPSTVAHGGGATVEHDTTVRDSAVALVPRTQAVQCIEDRARSLQGWRDEVWVERLRVQRYLSGGHYSHHYDWTASRGGWGRVSSMMVWVDAAGEGGSDEGLVGGGTEFPLLRKRSEDKKWCGFVECHGEDGKGTEKQESAADAEGGRQGEGIVFKPIPGNAVFWENFRSDGKGYEESWHAGLPVVSGVKVGLNIWSWGRLD